MNIPWTSSLPIFIEYILREEADGAREDWHSPLFHFARLVRSYFPEGTSAEAAFDQVDAVIRKRGGWSAVFVDVGDDEEAYTEFVKVWAKVRYRADETPLTNAVAKAKAHPLATNRGKKRALPGYDAFVSTAGWLQVTMGNRAILLPCRQLGELLGKSREMVSTWRQWAIEDGYLKIVKPHEFHPKGSKATEFLFDVSLWTCLSKVAQTGTAAAFDAEDMAL